MKKINSEEITFEDYQASIDGILEEISGEISNEENIDFAYITVYKQGKDAVKLSLNIPIDENTMHEIALDKTDKGLSLKYYNSEKIYSIFNDEVDLNEEQSTNNNTDNNLKENIFRVTKTSNTEEQENFEFNIIEKSNGEETGNYNFTLNRTGALTSDNVIFSILMPFNLEDGNINIQFKNTTNFSATPQFEEFTEGNHLTINGASPEQLNNLFTNLGAKISEKLQNEMFVSIISSNDALFDKAQQAQQDTQNAIEEERALTEQMQENFDVNQISPTTDDVTVNE